MSNDQLEPKCSIKLGTPNPVSFHEVVIPDSIELDLELRTAAQIDVLEYDEAKYGDAAAIEDFIRDRFYALLVQSLKKTKNGSLMRGGNPGKYLASLVKDELATYGIMAEVETFAFALTEDSEKRLKEAMEDARPYLTGETDSTDRLYSNFLDQSTFLGPSDYKSDCVPPPPFLFDPSKGPMQIFQDKSGNDLNAILERERETQQKMMNMGAGDKFCRNCGAKRMKDAKFCTECGNAFT